MTLFDPMKFMAFVAGFSLVSGVVLFGWIL